MLLTVIIGAIIAYILSLGMSRLCSRGTRSEIDGESSLGRSEEGCWEVRLRKEGKAIPLVVRLTVEIQNFFTGEKSTKTLKMAVGAGRETSLKGYVNQPGCGKIRCSVVRGKVTDHLGIIPVRKLEESRCNYTVLPEMFPIDASYAMREMEDADCQLYSPYQKGKDYSEIYNVREYEKGDSIKHIHWKLSGKTDEIMVKEGSFPIDRSIMIFMDKSTGKLKPERKHGEALASITFSLCQFFNEKDTEYTLVWNDVEREECFKRTISGEGDFMEVIPDLLGSPLMESYKSCMDLYRHIYGAPDATHIIYISCNREYLSHEMKNVHHIDASVDNYGEVYREIDIY